MRGWMYYTLCMDGRCCGLPTGNLARHARLLPHHDQQGPAPSIGGRWSNWTTSHDRLRDGSLRHVLFPSTAAPPFFSNIRFLFQQIFSVKYLCVGLLYNSHITTSAHIIYKLLRLKVLLSSPSKVWSNLKDLSFHSCHVLQRFRYIHIITLWLFPNLFFFFSWCCLLDIVQIHFNLTHKADLTGNS
jgi:hypothetical protein